MQRIARIIIGLSLALIVFARDGAQDQANLASLDLIWNTLRAEYWDASMAGLDWQAIHEQYLREMRTAAGIASASCHEPDDSAAAVIPSCDYSRMGI